MTGPPASILPGEAFRAGIYTVDTSRVAHYCIDTIDTGQAAMRVNIKKWGNSASVRIPHSVMTAANLHVDQAVEVREEDGRVVIEPIQSLSYDLDKLLAGMTPDTFHDEVDFGAPVGKEVW